MVPGQENHNPVIPIAGLKEAAGPTDRQEPATEIFLQTETGPLNQEKNRPATQHVLSQVPVRKVNPEMEIGHSIKSADLAINLPVNFLVAKVLAINLPEHQNLKIGMARDQKGGRLAIRNHLNLSLMAPGTPVQHQPEDFQKERREMAKGNPKVIKNHSVRPEPDA